MKEKETTINFKVLEVLMQKWLRAGLILISADAANPRTFPAFLCPMSSAVL